MKNIISNLVLVISVLLSVCSCDDFLDTTPKDRVSDKLIWKDAKRVNLYVNSFYPYIHDWGVYGSKQFANNMTEGLTETLKYGSSAAGNRYGDANEYAMKPEKFAPDGGLLKGWTSAYENIRRVNEFLVGLEKYSELDEDTNKIMEGQARFFRGFLYFQLAKRHGGVIIYTDMNLVKDKNRSSAAETWDLISNDLDFAASVLPEEWDNANKGRVTKGAALALKSRAMLYAERWNEAKDAADAVIALGKYSLVDDYAQATKGGNAESILEYNYLVSGPNHQFDMYYAPYGEIENLGGSATPTQEMVESYEAMDGTKVDWTKWHQEGGTTERPPYEKLEPRFHATVIYNGSIWKGKTMENCVDGTNGRYMNYREATYANGRTTTGYYLRKLMDESNTDLSTIKSTQTWVEIRLAEVYLNRAEANFRLGNESAALEDINTVRKRPGVNLPPKVGLSGDALFKAIRDERKIELSYEGHLYWDMRRWRLAHLEYNNFRVHGMRITKHSQGYLYEYVDSDLQDRLFWEKTYVLPVPQSEFANNSAIEQYDEWK
jgi:hypothetical protein